MAKITRKHQKVFAGSASNNGVFGSAQAGTKVLSSDPDTIQGLSAFDTGWLDAVISGQKLPTLEERQALDFLFSRQIAYLFQEGIPEYNASCEYHQYSVVKKTGTYELYGSKINSNTGNALPAAVDDSNWSYLGDLSNLSSGGAQAGDIKAYAKSTAPTGWLECNGAAISRTTYASLYAVIGTTWGAGDGSTTFNIPDFRGEFLRGWDNGRGVDSGRAFASAQDDAMQGHRHYVGQQDVDGQGPNNEGAANTTVGATSGWTSSGPTSDGTNGTPRTASETRPRNVSVLFCIKT